MSYLYQIIYWYIKTLEGIRFIRSRKLHSVLITVERTGSLREAMSKLVKAPPSRRIIELMFTFRSHYRPSR
jgi:hypothetical protein